MVEKEVYDKIVNSFASISFMKLIGANLNVIEEGYVEISLPFDSQLLQQNKYIHGAAIAAIGDTAGGYAALTKTELPGQLLTLEYKINFLRPSTGKILIAKANLIQNGKRVKVSICDIEDEVVSVPKTRTV